MKDWITNQSSQKCMKAQSISDQGESEIRETSHIKQSYSNSNFFWLVFLDKVPSTHHLFKKLNGLYGRFTDVKQASLLLHRKESIIGTDTHLLWKWIKLFLLGLFRQITVYHHLIYRPNSLTHYRWSRQKSMVHQCNCIKKILTYRWRVSLMH